MNPAIFASEKPRADPAQALRRMKKPRAREEQVSDAQADVHWINKTARIAPFLIHDLRAKLKQNLRNVDLDRTYLVAFAAQR